MLTVAVGMGRREVEIRFGYCMSKRFLWSDMRSTLSRQRRTVTECHTENRYSVFALIKVFWCGHGNPWWKKRWMVGFNQTAPGLGKIFLPLPLTFSEEF